MSQKMRIAFAGFRHEHIFAIWNWARDNVEAEIVASCEEDKDTRQQLTSSGRASVSHEDYGDMLQAVDCDIVAIGDYYAKHGPMVIKALQAGKHVICDKPLCTKLEELDCIEELAYEKGLSVMCMFDLRSLAPYITLREIILAGNIGEVHTVSFTGQHPLMKANRPSWYFEPGKQGGTILDIGVHGFDVVEWLTGLAIQEAVAARAWNAAAKSTSHFQDGAQFMLRLENDGGVLGDVSYLAPEKCGFSLTQYWDVCCHGSLGMARTNCLADSVLMATHACEKPQQVPLVDKPELPAYIQGLRAEIQGQGEDAELSTAEVFRATRLALQAQQVADERLASMVLS